MTKIFVIAIAVLAFIGLVVVATVYLFGEQAFFPRAPEEDIGNELEKIDFIRVSNPRPNQVIVSPLRVEGEARGYWFFEASFPVRLLDESGSEIPLEPGYIMTASDWMTEDFVPFSATLVFETPNTARGTLIFEKDNPSGLPENADQFVMLIRF